MSAATLPAQVGVSLGRVVRSEWTKLWSLRSTRWALLVSVVAMAGLGILVSAVQMAHWNQMSPRDQATFDPVDTSLGGWHLAQLAIGVLGVLLITGEYSTGQIRSTFAAVPHRLPVLWAKAGVYAAITFVLMILASFTAFLVSQPILRRHHVETTLSSPHVLRAVVGAALFLTVTGLFGLSLGALVAFNGYLAYLAWPTIALGFTLSLVRRGLTSMTRIQEIVEAPVPTPHSLK